LTLTGLNLATSKLKSGHWDYGSTAKKLEAAIAKRLDVPPEWVIATSSCTAALAAATFFLDEDRALRVPHMTYMSSYAWADNTEIILEDKGERDKLSGSIRVDCTDVGWPLSPVDIGVDLWGRAYLFRDSEELRILDAAHRFGAGEHSELAHRGTRVCYSFGPTKEYPSPGGGALVCNLLSDPETRERHEAWLRCGQSHRGEYHPHMGGIKGLISEISAAVVRHQLSRSTFFNEARQRLLATYENFLGRLLVTKPGQASGHLAVLRFDDEGWCNLVKKRLTQNNIQWSIHYRIHEHWKETCAYELSRRILSIPCHTQMKPFHAARIARLILTV
jgi:dTDP-4-amino-4,6-dideoxygalactose transaminase